MTEAGRRDLQQDLTGTGLRFGNLDDLGALADLPVLDGFHWFTSSHDIDSDALSSTPVLKRQLSDRAEGP
ncbi:hypothetical protein Kisp01_05130 [Kineosporia sp. NBRC 101677]|nr:hypothetical protein Kisp01_05130 [Kineosporia sp. NBRC 101677]